MRSLIDQIRLTDFRSYEHASLAPGGRSMFLFGPNGAGKTNFLEAISLLSPGRGLRGAALADVGRRDPGAREGRAWAISAELRLAEGSVRLGAGVETGGSSRRLVRIDGETVSAGVLTEHARPIWLTPAQDRLFLESATERRRFFDRLVYAALPTHAGNVAAYERALRERMRLLNEGPADPDWLTALEALIAKAGARVAQARARTLADLRAEIDARGGGAFPRANLGLAGEWEQLALAGEAVSEIEARLAAALARGRERDAAAGRALTGPHRGDLAVLHGEKRPPRRRMFHRRAESADSESGSGPGGATFACQIGAESYIVVGRSGGASRSRATRRPLRRDRGAIPAGLPDRHRRAALRNPQGSGDRRSCRRIDPDRPGLLTTMTDEHDTLPPTTTTKPPTPPPTITAPSSSRS